MLKNYEIKLLVIFISFICALAALLLSQILNQSHGKHISKKYGVLFNSRTKVAFDSF